MDTRTALPAPLRSEAFAEDLMADNDTLSPSEPAPVRWTTTLVPLGVALLGVAFAVLPPAL